MMNRGKDFGLCDFEIKVVASFAKSIRDHMGNHDYVDVLYHQEVFPHWPWCRACGNLC
jgi:hypothetical protein